MCSTVVEEALGAPARAMTEIVKVGMKTETLFSDGVWYEGQVTRQELGMYRWNITIMYLDGDEEETLWPQNNIVLTDGTIDIPDLDLSAVRSYASKEGQVLKAWFLYFCTKNRRMPEWHDCKVWLAHDMKWPVDQFVEHCRQPDNPHGRVVCNSLADKDVVEEQWALAKAEYLTLLHKVH